MNTITVSNSLDPDQARHFVGPDLDSNCFVGPDLDSNCFDKVISRQQWQTKR